MIKSKLISFIGKYNLGGTIPSVKLTVVDKVLTTSVSSDEKNMLGVIRMNDFELEDAEVGIHDTALLKTLLGVVSEDVKIELAKVDDDAKSLKITDKDGSKVNFTLAELDIIPVAPKLKSTPSDFELEIPLTKEFIARFIKAKAALNDVTSFTILQSENEAKELETNIIIGYSPTINSNSISLKVTPNAKKNVMAAPMSFSAKYFKEVLSANAEAGESTFFVSDKGLGYVEFGTDKTEFQSKYYFIPIKLAD